MSRRLVRRSVLIGAGAIIGTGALASVVACRPGGDSASLDLERLRGVVAEIRGADRVGPAYRHGKGTSALLAEFAARPGLQEVARHSCPLAARDALRAQVAEDFRNGDVVTADRFVMARSECILAALIT